MQTKKTAIVFGVNGQDGSYLAELLLERGYKVIGGIRRSSVNTKERMHNFLLHKNFLLEECDITDSASVSSLISKYKPDEIYNTAAQSHVYTSFSQPSYTFTVNTVGVLNILEAIRLLSPLTKMLQCSTSEMFGANFTEREIGTAWWDEDRDGEIVSVEKVVSEKYQDETTQFKPQSPYAVAKIAAHELVRLYRESYKLKVCSSICFNHESPRRGELFVTRKITKWLAGFHKIWNFAKCNAQDFPCEISFDDENIYVKYSKDIEPQSYPKLKLGNLNAYRDWGHAKDFTAGMFMMLQAEKQDDYVLGTGTTHTVGDFLSEAFKHIGIENWSNFVSIDESLKRPSEVEFLRARPAKIKAELGWEPTYTFEALVKDMMDEEINGLK